MGDVFQQWRKDAGYDATSRPSPAQETVTVQVPRANVTAKPEFTLGQIVEANYHGKGVWCKAKYRGIGRENTDSFFIEYLPGKFSEDLGGEMITMPINRVRHCGSEVAPGGSGVRKASPPK